MKWIWKRRSEFEWLEDEYKAARRHQARPAFVESLTAQIQSQATRRSAKGAFRYRAVLAVALTVALVAAAAAVGGLSYASSTGNHAASAISRVFSVAPTHDTATKNAPGLPSTPLFDSRLNPAGDDRDSPASFQYIEFVYVCLAVPPPPHHAVVHITLHIPKVAADNLVAHHLATYGAC
jgi:hypothetical protein